MENFVEQRKHRRHSSKLGAMLAINEGVTRLATTIVNLSGGGAMLEVADGVKLPSSLDLLFGHSIEPCTVMWQRARHVGIRFDAAPRGARAA